MNVRIILILLMYGLLIVCRPGSKKDECKSRLPDKQGLCGDALILFPSGIQNAKTEEDKNIFINAVLLDCIKYENEKQKCKDASSYQPTIY
jgi:hypothetical protein